MGVPPSKKIRKNDHNIAFDKIKHGSFKHTGDVLLDLDNIREESILYDNNVGKNMKILQSIPPIVRYDLLEGFDKKLKLLHEPTNNIDMIKNWHEQSDILADVVCFRGCLATIAASVHDTFSNWQCITMKKNGTLYLCMYEPPVASEPSMYALKAAYSGLKFENYMTGNENMDMSSKNQFYSVASAKLDGVKLLYLAEVDACTEQEHTRLEDYCEIKTNEKHISLGCRNFKYVKWWLQCWLMKIPKIVVGLKNKDFVVDEITIIERDSILKKWDMQSCINFLAAFLNNVKKECSEDDYKTSLRVYEKKTSQNKTCFDIISTRIYSHSDDYHKYNFLKTSE